MSKAYRKYLSVFSKYWDPARHTPKSFDEFEKFYKMALAFQERYDKDLQRGVMNPLTRYAKMNFDQFLGVEHETDEMKTAFHFAFKH